jgi:integrase
MRGCIVKRGPQSWAVVVYLGRDPQIGKPRQKWLTYKTRRAAEAAQARLITEFNTTGVLPPPPTRKPLADYMTEWLRDHAEGALRPTSLKAYRDTIRLHLAPALGDCPLSGLTPQRIQGYLVEKAKAGLSSTTVRFHAMVLHRVLQHAVKWGLLVRNPCDRDRLDLPKRRQVELRVLDEEQVRLFLGEAKKSSPHYPLYLAAVTTGMRIGELLGLRWRDVDLALGSASVQQTFYRLSGSKKTGDGPRLLFGTPKTEKGRRTVALPWVLVAELRRVKDAQEERRRLMGPEYQNRDLVFAQLDGKPLHAKNLTARDFRKVLERAGLPRIRFHDLRHSHATLLLAQGVSAKIVQERLGHASPAFTLAVYGHVLPGMQERATRNLEARLFRE